MLCQGHSPETEQPADNVAAQPQLRLNEPVGAVVTISTNLNQKANFMINYQSLLYALASLAPPLSPGQPVRRIGVGLPVPLDFSTAGAVGVGPLAPDGANFTACLTKLHGLRAACFRVLDGFREFLFHAPSVNAPAGKRNLNGGAAQ